MQSFHNIQVKLLIYCLSWRNKLPVQNRIKKKLSEYWSELAALFLVWGNLVTSTDLTAALTKGHSHSTNSHHLLWTLWKTEGHFELFLQISKHSHTCGFVPMRADAAGILQQLVSSSNLPLKCTGMKSMKSPLFQKFCQLSDNNLQGQPGELFQHFSQFCLWKSCHNTVGLQQTFHLYWNN
jgi:hypothetical protein